MEKTGGSLYPSPEMVCRLILSSTILHNFCIDHNLQYKVEILKSHGPYTELDYAQLSDNGVLVRENIMTKYFHNLKVINYTRHINGLSTNLLLQL